MTRQSIKDHVTALARRIFGFENQLAPWDNHDPIRAELFSIERMEEHARSLAAAQPVTPRPAGGRQLARRLAENDAMLLEAHHFLAISTMTICRVIASAQSSPIVSGCIS